MRRGGLAFAGSKRHEFANNKYIPNYDPYETSNCIVYWDANNLYGSAMSEYLPYKDLRFDRSVAFQDKLKTADDNDIGYIVEVDLHFPIKLHDRLKEPHQPVKHQHHNYDG